MTPSLLSLTPNLLVFLSDILKARCPRLKSLFLSLPSTQITSGGLLRFLRLTPSVTCYVFNIAWDFVMSDDIYVHLASRASLERIGLPDRSLTTTAADRILASIAHPFEKLDSIQCTANNDAFDQLIPHLTNLDDLCVSLLDRSDSVIFNLSKCANLTSLGISMDSELPRCPPAALLAISRRCTSLWKFSINIDSRLDNPPGRDGEFNDDFIQNFTSTLPKLEQFFFSVRDNSLTVESLRHLGRNCPRLETAGIKSALHLPDLGQSGPPALPILDHLEIGRLRLGTGNPDQELKDFVDTLYHHVPNLVILSTYRRQSFCRLVMEKLEALRKERGTEQAQRIV